MPEIVQVRGLDELRHKLGPDGVVPRPLRALVYKIKNKGLKEAKTLAKPHEGDIGSFANAMRASILSDSLGGLRIPLGARIVEPVPIAAEVEEGRKRGTGPGARAMRRWMKRHGMNTDWRSVKILMKRIRDRGTHGVFFMKRAGERVETELPLYIREAEAAMKAEWDR